MKLLKAFRYLDVRNIYKDAVGERTPRKIMAKVKPLVEKKARELINECKQAREKLKDIPGTNYNLALYHFKKGNIEDAILRFKMVTYLAPEKAEAYYGLGRSLIKKGKLSEAEENLQKAISLKPGYAEAQYILATITSPGSIDIIPQHIVQEHLEHVREDVGLRQQQDKVLVGRMLANIKDKNPNLEVLDIGCGEGGRGKLLKEKEVAKGIVGFDLSVKLAAVAKNQKLGGEQVYSAVETKEISGYLSRNKGKFDAILAGDVFAYNGNLDNIFFEISQSMVKNGVFAAIVVTSEDVEGDYMLDAASDKFVHSVSYFLKCLAKHGLKIEENQDKEIEGKSFNIIIARK